MEFRNPYAAVLQAVKNLYGDIPVKIIWDTQIRRRLFFGCWGYTYWEDGTKPRIHISAHLPVYHSTEILAHELAHVVAGCAAKHGAAWEEVFDKIHEEYLRVANER